MTKRMRLKGLDMALSTGNAGSHLGGSFSCMEILAVLYGEVLRLFDNEDSKLLSDTRDIFIPSKNHCVLAHIPALAEAGLISDDECMEFQKNGGRLAGYPMRQEIGLEYSGGSLGMALPVAIGMAIADKEKKTNRRFYVLLGDAELNEGSIWEAFMSAAHYKLDNLVAIIDRNHLSYDGDTEDVMALGDLSAKMKSFGWFVSECNGREVADVLRAFDERYVRREAPDEDSALESDAWILGEDAIDKPQVIIVDTIKGMGVSFMEGRPEWHHHRLSEKEYNIARAEILGEEVAE